ncbi:hypothetical protein Q0Z83_005330 [Actinoplanes sichuanensis]|uniref:Uncharacterized protein n=1 Tax=Actinoplanes sichuanensis TaxID=512349 RepID=A0ABW4AFW3_9ACTN|nr:hypothetical protein [Actinoplanes sichuanensis]BEL02342.1 hypothetical protein Q0Z83_005330 [Actinoplanes sichuanensis]
MRRALYLGGIFLATGAAVAMAAPAQAGGHPCPGDVVITSYDYVQPVGFGYGYGHGFGHSHGDSYYSNKSITQGGSLVNIAAQDSNLLGGIDIL